MKLTENQHKVEDETNQPSYTDFHKLGEKDNDECRQSLEKDTMQTNDEENTNDSMDYKMIFAEKCHLSYFDKESKMWITVGLGIAKILERKDDLQFRVIMTSKKVNTICADHLITCHMKLLPKDSKQRSFTYWSKIKHTDLKEECLQVKFANKNKASQFAEIFNECCRKLNEDDKVSIDRFTVDSEDIHQVGRRFVCQARQYSDRYLNTNQEENPMYSTKIWVAQTCFIGSHSYAANKSCFRVACTDTTLTDTTMEGACNFVETDKESKELSIGDMVTFSCIDTTYTIDLTDSEDSFKTSYHSCLTPEKVTNPLEAHPSYCGSSLKKPYPTTNYYVNHEVLNTETIFPNYSCSVEPLLPGLDFIDASRPENVNRNRYQDHYSNTDDTTTDTSLLAPAMPPQVFNTNSFLRPLKCPLFYNSFNEQQVQDNVHFVFPTREQGLSITKAISEDVSSSKTKTHQNNTSVFGNQEKNSKVNLIMDTQPQDELNDNLIMDTQPQDELNDNLIMDAQPQDELNYSLTKKENIYNLVGAGKSELDSDKTDLPQVIDETENKCENTAPKERKIKTVSKRFKRRQNQTNQIHEIITESHVNEHGDVGITETTDYITKGLSDDQNTVDDIKVQAHTESKETKENQSTELVVLNIGKGDPPVVTFNDEEGDPVHTGYTYRNCEGGDLKVESDERNGDTNYTGQKVDDGDMISESYHQIVDASSTGDQKGKDGDPNVESDDQNGDTTSIGQNLKEGDVNVESGTYICDIGYPGLNLEDADPIDESNDQNGAKNYLSREKEVGDRKDESYDQNGDKNYPSREKEVGDRKDESNDQNGDKNYPSREKEVGDRNVESNTQMGDTNITGKKGDDGDTNSESNHHIGDTSYTSKKSCDDDPSVESNVQNSDTNYTFRYKEDGDPNGHIISICLNRDSGDFNVTSACQNSDVCYRGRNLDYGDPNEKTVDQNGQDKEFGNGNVESNPQMGDTNITGQKGNDGDMNSEFYYQIVNASSTGDQKGKDGDPNGESDNQNGDTTSICQNSQGGDPNGTSKDHNGDTSVSGPYSQFSERKVEIIDQNVDTNYTQVSVGDQNVAYDGQIGDTSYARQNLEDVVPNHESNDQNCNTYYSGQDNEVGDRNIESNTQMGDTNIAGQKGDDGDMSVESNVQNSDTNYIGINKENGDANNESNNQNRDTRSTGKTDQGDDTNVETEGQNGDTKFTSQNRGNGDPNVESNDQDGDTNHAGQNSNDIGANADTVNQNVDTNYTCQNRGDLESNDQNGFLRYTVENSEDCGHNVESDDQNPDTINISKKRKDDDPNYNSDNQNCETLHSDENKEHGCPHDHKDDTTVTDHNMRKTYDNNTTNDKNDKPAHRYINIEPNSSHESTENELRDLSSVDSTYTPHTTTPKFRRNSSESSNVKSKRKRTRKRKQKNIQDERNAETEVEAEKDLWGVYNRDSKEGLNSSVGGKNNEHLDLHGEGVKPVVTRELVDEDSTLMLQGVGTEQVDEDCTSMLQGVGTEQVDTEQVNTDNAVNFNAVDKQEVGTEQVDEDCTSMLQGVGTEQVDTEQVNTDNAVNFNAVDKQEVGTEQVDTDNTLNDKRKSPNDENETTNSIDEKKMETLVILEGQTKIDNMQVEVDDDDLDEDCTINALHVPERKYSANDDSNHTRDDDTLEDERGASPIEIIVQVDDTTDERKEIQDVENVSQCYARKVNKKSDESDDKPYSNTTHSRNNNSSLKYVGLLLILIFSFFIVFQFLL